jgi:plastocyanin
VSRTKTFFKAAIAFSVLTAPASALLSCSSDKGVVDPGQCNIPASVPAGAVVVRIQNFAFNSDRVTVKSGGQVAWVNCGAQGTESHTATSDTGIWDSPSLKPGEAYIRTFSEAAGTSLPYHCIPHPFMTGTVDVN